MNSTIYSYTICSPEGRKMRITENSPIFTAYRFLYPSDEITDNLTDGQNVLTFCNLFTAIDKRCPMYSIYAVFFAWDSIVRERVVELLAGLMGLTSDYVDFQLSNCLQGSGTPAAIKAGVQQICRVCNLN